MLELPRITRALRAHTQLDKPRCLKSSSDIKIINQLVNQKSQQRYVKNYLKTTILILNL